MNSNNIGIVVVVILDGSKYNSHRSAFLVGAGKLGNVVIGARECWFKIPGKE